MKKLSLVLSLSLASCSSGPPEVCEQMLECCQSLAPELSSACEDGYQQAIEADEDLIESACRSALDVLTAAGSCEARSDPAVVMPLPNLSPAQGLSQPCDPSFGLDACGAGLFCAAFDGRTVPSCYAERSRQTGETCQADRHCVFNACSDGGRCQAGSGLACTPDVGCAEATQICDVSEDWSEPALLCLPIGFGSEGSRCGEDRHCAEGRLCVDRRCQTDRSAGAACASTSGCDEGLRCIEGQCRVPPAMNSECRPGYGECPANEHCDLIDFPFDPILLCTADGTAGLDERCNAGSVTCRAPYVCLPTVTAEELRCVAPCRLDTMDCPEGGFCQDLSALGFSFGVCI